MIQKLFILMLMVFTGCASLPNVSQPNPSSSLPMGDAVKAEVRGKGRQWKVNTGEEMDRFLKYFTVESFSPKYHIGMSEFTVQFTKSDGSSQNVSIGGGAWETKGGRGLMAEDWRSYFYDLKNHDPSIRKAEYAKLTKEKQLAQLTELKKKLEPMVIDELKFHNAEPNEVLGYLTHATRELDPEGIGVNMIFMDPEPYTQIDSYSIPRISIALSNVSIFDALMSVVELSNRKIQCRGDLNLVIIGYPPFVTREYRLNPAHILSETLTQPEDMKDLFRQHGIEFPIGTEISYDSIISSFFITTTEEVFLKIEEAWEKIDQVPSKVEKPSKQKSGSSQQNTAPNPSGQVR